MVHIRELVDADGAPVGARARPPVLLPGTLPVADAMRHLRQRHEEEPDGALLLPGDFPLHDLPDVGVRVTFPLSREYTTVAGLVLAGLGRLPEGPGERVRLPGLTVEVLEVAGRAIRRVRLRGPAVGRTPD